MKFTLTNLILLITIFAVLIVSLLDKNRLKAELAEKDATRCIAFRQLFETGSQPLYLIHHAEERELSRVLNRENFGRMHHRPTDAAFEILEVCKSYNQFKDKELPDAFIRLAMDDNHWQTMEDLQEWLRKRNRLAEEVDTDRAAALIDSAIRSR
jgi:hypothetical protein